MGGVVWADYRFSEGAKSMGKWGFKCVIKGPLK